MLVSTMRELSCATPAEAGSLCAGLLATFCKFIATNEKGPSGAIPRSFSPLFGVSHACHGRITFLRRGGSCIAILERSGFVAVFRSLGEGTSHDRTPQASNAQGCLAKDQIRAPQDVAATLVTMRDARERRAGSEEGCLQADECQEDR